MQNELFTFEIDSENSLVGCTLDRHLESPDGTLL
jgi:hypothetical protein